ncbi:MAG: hypothetical protein IAI50_18095, partial [Candidatus Eremiobacteraeota bacterium]|nr:hypothetical protein [Candidatus Eremiobacteraeota bacterium]
VDFGPIAFHDFLTYAVTQHGAYDGSADGIVGPDFLRYFDVTLDYGHAKAYFIRY